MRTRSWQHIYLPCICHSELCYSPVHSASAPAIQAASHEHKPAGVSGAELTKASGDASHCAASHIFQEDVEGLVRALRALQAVAVSSDTGACT